MPAELTAKEEEALRQARAVIDEAIRYAGFSERITVSADKLPLLSFKAIDRLSEVYRRTGWNKAEMIADPQAGEVFDLQA